MLILKNKKSLVMWGASGFASVVSDAIILQQVFNIYGFIDNVNPDRKDNLFCGKVILGGKEQLPLLKAQQIDHVAFGFGNCSAKTKIGKLLIDENFSLVNVCHPNATVASSAKIGRGAIILAGAVIDPDCVIGDYCIVNKNSVIGHNSKIGDSVNICPGVNIAGRVNIGSSVWVGIGSCIIEKIKIGSGSFIGAGSVVVKDIPENVLAFGNPARVIRKIDFVF